MTLFHRDRTKNVAHDSDVGLNGEQQSMNITNTAQPSHTT